MFKRKLGTDAFTNLIAQQSEINGTVSFSGIIKIQGVVKGDILSHVEASLDDAIIVDNMGSVQSDLMKASNVVIAGAVFSKCIHAENTLRLLATAKMHGATVYYRTLEIEPGALLDNCQMKHLDYCSEGEQT